MPDDFLRPIERRIVAMKSDGLTTEDIAQRLNKSPTHVSRMMRWIEIPRSRPAPRRYAEALESRVVHMRADGLSHEQIGTRLGKSADFSQRIERLASLRKES